MIFVFMLRPPTISKLFPYTTLFRSKPIGASRRRSHDARGDRARDARGGDGIPSRDRKSTRLNSSHVENSYAVFCLKNKMSALANEDVPDSVLRAYGLESLRIDRAYT